MMFSMKWSRVLRLPAARRFATSAASEGTAASAQTGKPAMMLNFSCPQNFVYHNEPVALVNVPGMTGVYGIAPDMAPTISELKPGQVVIQKEDDGKSETFFIPSGYALTHASSKTDVVATDIVQLEDMDGDAAKAALVETQAKISSLTEGTPEHAEARIELDVYEAACHALGMTV